MSWLTDNWLKITDILRALIIGGLVIIGLSLLGEISHQAHQIKVLNDRIAVLGSENHDLNQKQVDYTKCGFGLFAKFTRDGLPITIKDLGDCAFSSKAGVASPAVNNQGRAGAAVFRQPTQNNGAAASGVSVSPTNNTPAATNSPPSALQRVGNAAHAIIRLINPLN